MTVRFRSRDNGTGLVIALTGSGVSHPVSVHPGETTVALGRRQVERRWDQAVHRRVLLLVVQLDVEIVQVLQVVQVCAPLGDFIRGRVLVAAVLLEGQQSVLRHTSVTLDVHVYQGLITQSRPHLDDQVTRRVSGHPGEFIGQLFEGWTHVFINHPTWRRRTGCETLTLTSRCTWGTVMRTLLYVRCIHSHLTMTM